MVLGSSPVCWARMPHISCAAFPLAMRLVARLTRSSFRCLILLLRTWAEISPPFFELVTCSRLNLARSTAPEMTSEVIALVNLGEAAGLRVSGSSSKAQLRSKPGSSSSAASGIASSFFMVTPPFSAERRCNLAAPLPAPSTIWPTRSKLLCVRQSNRAGYRPLRRP